MSVIHHFIRLLTGAALTRRAPAVCPQPLFGGAGGCGGVVVIVVRDFPDVVRDFLDVVRDFLNPVDLRVVIDDAVVPVVFGDAVDLALGLLPCFVLVLGFDLEHVVWVISRLTVT